MKNIFPLINVILLLLYFVVRYFIINFNKKEIKEDSKIKYKVTISKNNVANGRLIYFRLEKHFQVDYKFFKIWKFHKTMAYSNDAGDILKYLKDHNLTKEVCHKNL